MAKLKKITNLKRVIRALKKKKKSIVFTNGCFDILHPGHIKILRDAKSKGDILVVGLNSDSSVKRLKGKGRPVVNLNFRSGTVASLECVDYVTSFSEETPLNLIKSIKPDVLVKGADWNRKNIVGADFVRSYGGKVLTIKLVKGLSTTNLIKRIAKLS